MNYLETDLVVCKVMTGPVWIVKMMNGRHINIHKSWSGRVAREPSSDHCHMKLHKQV